MTPLVSPGARMSDLTLAMMDSTGWYATRCGVCVGGGPLSMMDGMGGHAARWVCGGVMSRCEWGVPVCIHMCVT